MLSLNQSMFRSAPEKHCLGRSHHSCSVSTKCAICSCYMNISNSREKKHQPDNKKHTAKPCILILKTKTSKNLSLPLHGPLPLLTTPVLSFSFPLDLTSGMEAVCLMENPHPVLWMFFQGKPEPSSLDSYHQHQPSVCWSVQSFSGGINRWECRRRREDTPKWIVPSILHTRMSTNMSFWDTQVYCSFTVQWQVQSSHKTKSFK